MLQDQVSGQEKSQEGQGRNGTESDVATVVRSGVRRDKKGMYQYYMRPLWSGEKESGGARKGMDQDQERPAEAGRGCP